ncbi:MAG TPA: amidohydrolase family protein [Candidatus Dormibacteraeota bacterium]|nr:amidohydrolase family protein [Candidatus Dormibacteraeota bacterium]
MKIDAHQHFWNYDPVRDAWITEAMSVLRRDFLPEHLGREMDASGIAASVAVQADQSESETRFLLELAQRYKTVAGVVGWVDLRATNLSERLEYFSQFDKLCGFRHIVQNEPDDRFLLSEEFLRGIACLKQFGYTYDILIYPRQLPAAIEIVDKFPDQRFVIDHLAKPLVKNSQLEPWTAQMKTIAANRNVYCKVSGLVTEGDWANWRADDFRPYIDVVFDAFGSDRVLFGSDWPVCLLAATYRQVHELISNYTKDLSAGDKQKIFGMNAIRFYKLRMNSTMSA